MLIDFFLHLRAAKLKVSINELLTLLEAIRRDVRRHLEMRLARHARGT